MKSIFEGTLYLIMFSITVKLRQPTLWPVPQRAQPHRRPQADSGAVPRRLLGAAALLGRQALPRA